MPTDPVATGPLIEHLHGAPVPDDGGWVACAMCGVATPAGGSAPTRGTIAATNALGQLASPARAVTVERGAPAATTGRVGVGRWWSAIGR